MVPGLTSTSIMHLDQQSSSHKNILLWGAPFAVPKGEPYMISYERAGLNFGNLLIGNGAASVLTGYNYVLRDQISSPEEADEKCTHIVIPAANFLWKGFDLGFMADFIEASHLPVTIVGLGAQSHDRSFIADVHPNTLRLIKIISERSPSIGVRGYYSAEVLASNGITNIEVLGCPSLYTLGAPPSTIKNPADANIANLVVNFSRVVASHSFSENALKKVENALLKIAIKNKLAFVAQDELDELAISTNSANSGNYKEVTSYFSLNDPKQTIDYYARHTRYFCNVKEWFSFIATRSGSIGSRLHGNIAALINGIPGLIIAHDSRTIEICALLALPYIHIKQIEESEYIPEYILDRFRSADYTKFLSNLKDLFRRYKKFLQSHNLQNIL